MNVLWLLIEVRGDVLRDERVPDGHLGDATTRQRKDCDGGKRRADERCSLQ